MQCFPHIQVHIVLLLVSSSEGLQTKARNHKRHQGGHGVGGRIYHEAASHQEFGLTLKYALRNKPRTAKTALKGTNEEAKKLVTQIKKHQLAVAGSLQICQQQLAFLFSQRPCH